MMALEGERHLDRGLIGPLDVVSPSEGRELGLYLGDRCTSPMNCRFHIATDSLFLLVRRGRRRLLFHLENLHVEDQVLASEGMVQVQHDRLLGDFQHLDGSSIG